MCSSRAILGLVLVATLAGSASAATATRPSAFHPVSTTAVDTDHLARVDGSLANLGSLRNRLLTGFRISLGIWIVDLPFDDGDFEVHLTDGGETVDPLGVKGGGINGTLPPTASSTRRR